MTATTFPAAVEAAAAAGQTLEFRVEAQPGEVVRYDLAALCSILGINDPTRVAVETDGLRAGMVTVYPSNPLAKIREVRREDLVMDHRGYVTVGVYHNGRPARVRLYDPSTGSAQRFLTFGTTGAGKSRALQLLLMAEKLNGIVSWVCDLKNGQSVPEARNNVDWFGATLEEAIWILRVAVAVAQERMARYSALGRTAFMLGRPDPLLHASIEEANRLLEKGSPYRDEAAYLVTELGRTGRSVGVGVRLNAQASHLEELGGSDTLRAMLKEGEVSLLRWSSSMMKQLVADGLLPAGEQLMPIPKTLRPRLLRSQFDLDVDDEVGAPGTQGMGYLLSSAHPSAMMRYLQVGSVAPTPGLDPVILGMYGDGEPARLELASRSVAGAAYAARNDPAAMAVLCEAIRNEQQQEEGSTGKTSSSAASRGPRRASLRLEDRAKAALQTIDTPATADAVLEAVNADGGREVKLGSVKNALRSLKDDGEATLDGRDSEGHGLYAPAH